uniref:Uncharacterized protein n=1 Tax=Rousettus aegyptiacus TaxID=9407 RepID=A0A7J8F094_ROUAE|nr:hypothetical protein HJG63_012328 [Rousettus aegyptiacus]
MAYLAHKRLQPEHPPAWGRFHLQAHSGCWQNSVPCSCRPECFGCLLVVGRWLPSASCHIDDPSTPTHPRASYLFKVSEGVFRASMQARWTHISYCNHYLRHVLLPEVTDLALTQAENMSNRRQDFQGPPKSSSATVSQDPLEI